MSKKQDRVAIHTEETKLNRLIQEAEADLVQIRAIRAIAEELTQTPVKSLTGHEEVVEFVHVKEYPNASKRMQANLLGVAELYDKFMSEYDRLSDLDRFTIHKGEPVVCEKWKECTKDDLTMFLTGKRKDHYYDLTGLVEHINKLGYSTGLNLGQMVYFDRSGEAHLNIGNYLLFTSDRERTPRS